MRRYGLFIDGNLAGAASGRTTESIDPATGEVVAVTSRAAPTDARRAIAAARRAFDSGDWSSRAPESRRDLLLAICETLGDRQAELAALESRDTGVPIRSATISVAAAIHDARELVRLAASVPLTEPLPHNEFPVPSWNALAREPFGVCAAITPFTAPLTHALRKVIPALAMGNTVVLKPSPHTPCSAMEIARAAAECGLPPGCLNVLPGADADVARELASNALVDRVSFTGSTATGRILGALAAQTAKSATLQLGGKNANILLDDADLDVAIPAALWAAFLDSGQTCTAGSRLLVPRALHDDIVDRLTSAITQMRVGPTGSWDTDVGPLISTHQLERIDRHVSTARADGAILACGGHRLTDDALRNGFYYAPTVLAEAGKDMRVAHEEVLGPVLAVIPYTGPDEAVAIANATAYGLAAAVWSRDVPRALAVARRLRAGTVWVNEYHVTATSAPFGGYAQSGVGKELGVAGCLEWTQSKHIWVDQGHTLASRAWPPMLGLDRIFGVDYE